MTIWSTGQICSTNLAFCFIWMRLNHSLPIDLDLAEKGSEAMSISTEKKPIRVIDCFNAERTFLLPASIMMGQRKLQELEDKPLPGSRLFMFLKSPCITSNIFADENYIIFSSQILLLTKTYFYESCRFQIEQNPEYRLTRYLLGLLYCYTYTCKVGKYLLPVQMLLEDLEVQQFTLYTFSKNIKLSVEKVRLTTSRRANSATISY